MHCHRRLASLCVVALTLLADGCTKYQLLNATVPYTGYTRTSDIAYAALPRQTLDVYRPRGAKIPAAIVVFFYGGSWQEGEKSGYRFVGQALASRGFIAVLPDYRLYPQVTFPAFVEDGALAVKWVHDHAAEIGGDADHVYLMGHSAGAHIAALLTLDASYLAKVGLPRSAIRATAALSGPYDFVPTGSDRGVFNMTLDDATPPPAIEPIHFVDGHAPPMLLVQGLKDTTVEPGNATRLAAAIRAAGGSVKVIEYPKRAHVGIVLALAWPFRWIDPILRDTAAYFRDQEARP